MKEAQEQRSAVLERTAKENCALEEQAEQDCFTQGGWSFDRLRQCHNETRALERCTQLQTKFLRTLGYLSVPGRSMEEEERIQMHADSLYQQMLQHEEAIRQAKEQGLPPPEFKPVMSRENMAKVLGISSQKPVDLEAEAIKAGVDPQKLAEMKENARKKLNDKWKHLSAEERAAEEASLLSKMQERQGMLRDYYSLKKETSDARQKRQDEGKQTVADRLYDWWNR
jgi:hypothetical protein